MNHQIISYQDDTFRTAVGLQNECLTLAPAKDRAEHMRSMARKLSAHAFSNLDSYQYVFFTAGATEAIDFLVTKQPTKADLKEYRYVFAHPTVKPNAVGSMKFMSYPFSGTGSRRAIPTECDVILDCSYIFATAEPFSGDLPSNVKHVIFSLSKSHNLYDARCGWFFTNTRFPGLFALQYEYGYVSAITERCLYAASQYEPNLLYRKHAAELSAKYRAAGLVEPETNLFALNADGERIPHYLC